VCHFFCFARSLKSISNCPELDSTSYQESQIYSPFLTRISRNPKCCHTWHASRQYRICMVEFIFLPVHCKKFNKLHACSPLMDTKLGNDLSHHNVIFRHKLQYNLLIQLWYICSLSHLLVQGTKCFHCPLYMAWVIVESNALSQDLSDNLQVSEIHLLELNTFWLQFTPAW